MRFKEIMEAVELDQSKIETIIDIARKHQGYVTKSQLVGIFDQADDAEQVRLLNQLRLKYRINIVDDLKDITNTQEKIKKLDAESKKVFDYFTDPKRNNINNDVVKDLMADALLTKKIDATNWMTLTNNIKAGDGSDTRGAEWNVGRKLGKLGVKIDQSLTIGQKKTAIQPSDKDVQIPSELSGADAKVYQKIVSKTNSQKRKMVSTILLNAFKEKNMMISAGEPSQNGAYVILPKDLTNKLLANTAMRAADVGRALGPLGIGLTF